MAEPEPPPGEDAGAPRLRLRRATDADAPDLLRLSLDAIQVTAAEYYTSQQLEAWAALRSVESHERMVRTTHVLVAELDRELAGFVNLDTAAAVVDQLFVSPASGGSGVATALLAGIEVVAEREGLAELTARASMRAVRTFERCGYRRTRTEHVTLGDQVLERYEVRKELRGVNRTVDDPAGA